MNKSHMEGAVEKEGGQKSREEDKRGWQEYDQNI